MVESGPIPAIHGVVRWRLKDLAQWLWEEFGISVSQTTLSRELKALGFGKLSARPRHYAQNELALEQFKRMARPVCKEFVKLASARSTSTYPACRLTPPAKMEIRTPWAS
jgi:hypothetical protein